MPKTKNDTYEAVCLGRVSLKIAIRNQKGDQDQRTVLCEPDRQCSLVELNVGEISCDAKKCGCHTRDSRKYFFVEPLNRFRSRRKTVKSVKERKLDGIVLYWLHTDEGADTCESVPSQTR